MVSSVSGTALLLEQMLGSTLASVVKAQGLVATQLAEFIERVGFEPREADEDEEEPLRARTFSFEFSRSEVGEGDVVVQRRVTATLPLLSIVTLPALAIESADIQMDLRLVATEPAGPAEPAPPVLRPDVRPVKLWAVPARALPVRPFPSGTGQQAPSAGATGQLSVRVTLRSMDAPLGLERVERLLANGYVEDVRDEEP